MMEILHSNVGSLTAEPPTSPCESCDGVGGDPEGERVCPMCLGTGVDI